METKLSFKSNNLKTKPNSFLQIVYNKQSWPCIHFQFKDQS